MSSDQEKIYCFDSSIFISLNRIHNYIPIPSVWQELEKLFNEGKIISHEFVYSEFNPEREKPDFLAKWLKDKKEHFYKITDKQVELTSRILEKFPTLIDYEKEKNQADPWIIALAIEKMEEITLFSSNTLIYVVICPPKSRRKEKQEILTSSMQAGGQSGKISSTKSI